MFRVHSSAPKNTPPGGGRRTEEIYEDFSTVIFSRSPHCGPAPPPMGTF